LVTRKHKHILIAPLDWGLGHTTRCVPLIRFIQQKGHIPVFAGNETQCSFIEDTFGPIDFIHLEGYNITYSKWNQYAQMGLLSQLPHILGAIKNEHRWLQNLVAEGKIDGVISDNRYGLYHPAIPSVILTHQLQIQSGFGNVADNIVRKLHYKFLNRFNDVWVVDSPSSLGIAGKLSHPNKLPNNTTYIGALSQFENRASAANTNKDQLLILLSGPEPQRTVLSAILWQQMQEYNGKVVFVEGSESAPNPASIPANVEWHKRLNAKALEPILCDAGMVVCRSGYSTIMDLIALQKQAILIPTPGQTEQEYLATRLHKAGIFFSAPQKNFELQEALSASANFNNTTDQKDSFQLYKPVLKNWLEQL
jgi:UDP:flavonoid glycosyltransferase YjiC (YdhE family)